MKSSDVPHLAPPLPTRPVKSVRPADPPPPAARVAAGSLAPASESSDPAVHRLLAHRQAHSDAGDERGVAAVDAKLAALGCR
jgi:hypothetical protein